MWIVLIRRDEGTELVAYGPMEAGEAELFAEFLERTVGTPAAIRTLNSPTREVLGWFKQETDRNQCNLSPGCEVHPDANYLHHFDGRPAKGIDCTRNADCPVHPGWSEARHLLETAEAPRS